MIFICLWPGFGGVNLMRIGKIHWISQKRLCLPKCFEGLGFQDLELFNRALLAEQCWRILSDPASLLACVLKYKYFLNCDFLDANEGGSTSFIWRSLVWERDLERFGLRWRVGTGENIHTYSDKQVPNGDSFHVQSRSTLPLDIQVSELCMSSGSWDRGKILAHFGEDDVTFILNIPLNVNSIDRLIWSSFLLPHLMKHFPNGGRILGRYKF